MSIYIAMDAGGTKTETLVHDETGHILLRDVTPGCNAMDLGIDEAQKRAAAALTRVLPALPAGKPDRAFCGIASIFYFNGLLTDALDARFPDWNITWSDDGQGMITSMLGARDGCCIVCGTGSSLFARAQGVLHHIGGWGYLIDTCGSGFILGREAILAAVRQADGRGEKTVLYDLVQKELGAPPEDCVPRLYAGGRPFFASFAHTVFEGCRSGDRISREIFERGAAGLAEMTRAAQRYYDGAFDVVLSGGIFAAYPEYAEAVRAKGAPNARLIRADVPPVMGCALENALADYPVDMPAFKARFMADYAALRARG